MLETENLLSSSQRQGCKVFSYVCVVQGTLPLSYHSHQRVLLWNHKMPQIAVFGAFYAATVSVCSLSRAVCCTQSFATLVIWALNMFMIILNGLSLLCHI